MPLITRREAARRLWELARRYQRAADRDYPAPTRLPAETQNEVNLLIDALNLGAEALEPVGRVEEEDAFSEGPEPIRGVEDWLDRRKRGKR